MSIRLPARQTLMEHWALFYLEGLLRLSAIPPSSQCTATSPERTRELDELLEAGRLRIAHCRRIASYLGHELPPGHEMPEYKPNLLSALEAARLVDVFVQNGESFETIALFLEKWRKPGRKRGRPTGSNDPDSLALRALELHDSGPDWTWPKVADELCKQKGHAPHGWKSTCTESLKHSVERLQKFLQELESIKTARRKQDTPSVK